MLVREQTRSYTTVSWDYSPSPAAHHNALLSRGASHSRFLRIAYLSTRAPLTTSSPRSTHPPSHRRRSQWPKPPHYHASLLRSPLSHRKGLFRTVLEPKKAVDFFRWDVLPGAGVSFSTCQERDRTCASLYVAEWVLEPYEAAAGFFGWHGLGLDVIQREDECHPSDRAGKCNLHLDIDEAAVDEGRARWARMAQELVGPRWVVEDGKVITTPFDLDARASPSIRKEVRWNPEIGSSSSRPTSTSDEKKQLPPSNSNLRHQVRTDSPSAWWYGPPPHLPPHRLPPPQPVQYGPPPLHLSPYFSSGRAQGHGYWYGQHTGPPSSVDRDPNLTKPHSHIFAGPVTPHLSQSPRHPTKPSLARDGHRPGNDCDKETETDHGYESTTTTTDSDPPPHTPIGTTTTSHYVGALQVHGDNEVEVHGIEIDAEHASASVTFDLSEPSTPVKLLDGFSPSTSPSVSSGSPESSQTGYEFSKATVVFPSLNGSFRQGSSSSHMSASLSSQAMSLQTTPARVATPASSSHIQKVTPLGDHFKSGLESSLCSASSDNPAFMLSLCSPPPPTSPGSGLRKDSQGFWEPISPCSSSSSLSLSPSESKTGSRPEWIGDKKGDISDSHEAVSLHPMFAIKSRSLSPGPRRVTGASSCSGHTSLSSPMSTPASVSMFGGSYPSSPSPPNNLSLVPPNATTLLPAFLATATVKRKKASRTREIVDRLRSSSIDAGKGGVGLDGLGWLASPSGDEEVDGKTSGSDHAARGQPSPPPPPKSNSNSTPSDPGKNLGQVPGSKSSESSSSAGKSTGSKTLSRPTSKTTTNASITPFPILSVSQPLVSNFTMLHQKKTSNSGDGSKTKATVTMSPNARSHLPGTPSGSTSPSKHPCHHRLPSPSRPVVHLPPALGPPPPMVAVSSYPHPMYVPVTQYRLAPPHQGPQGQGTWLALYPGPLHVPVHPLPTQTHVSPITGVSGMRHVSW